MKTEFTFFRCVFLICLFIGMSFYGCQDQVIPEPEKSETDLVLKKGGKPTTDVGDLYGDLWQLERDNSGVPIIYPMLYRVDYQDQPILGHIDVMNPRLTQNFTMNIISRDDDGYVIFTTPTDGSDPVPVMVQAEIILDQPGGFIQNLSPTVLYDAEGSILPEAANYVMPVDEGRLNLVRSPSDVLTSRMTEVISNFGDGTVWRVTRDFCGRFYMVRTQDAIDAGILDKPIDSPLENMAIYKELMLYGFSRPATQNGLSFLGSGFDVFNLAAACVSASSDKSGVLNIDEIVFLNLFLGVPEPGTGISQVVHQMEKTTKQQTSVTRWYVDYSGFSYDRNNFKNTFLDLYSIVYENGTINKVLIKEDLVLNGILSGEYPGEVLGGYRYTPNQTQLTGAVGFANLADDYVQALEVVHNNEEFLVWQAATPWENAWRKNPAFERSNTPFFTVTLPEVSHGNKPGGVGDGTKPGGGGHRGGR